VIATLMTRPSDVAPSRCESWRRYGPPVSTAKLCGCALGDPAHDIDLLHNQNCVGSGRARSSEDGTGQYRAGYIPHLCVFSRPHGRA